MGDHMSIGSGLVHYLIAKCLKKFIAKKLNCKEPDISLVFNSPIEIDNDGEFVDVSLNVSARMKYVDLLSLVKSLDI